MKRSLYLANFLLGGLSVTSLAMASESYQFELMEPNVAEIEAAQKRVLQIPAEKRQEIRGRLANLRVEDVGFNDGLQPTPHSMLVRRSLEQYEADLANHARENNIEPQKTIVLFSGHEGPHTSTFNTGQGLQYYMVDMCWIECQPDYVMDAKNPAHWQYFPDNWADQIVADDARFLSDENIPQALRVLKIGGRLVFKPGFGMGWPQPMMSRSNVKGNGYISASGRGGAVDYPRLEAWSASPQEREKWKETRQQLDSQFQSQAWEQALRYYRHLGVELVTMEEGCFVLHKGEELAHSTPPASQRVTFDCTSGYQGDEFMTSGTQSTPSGWSAAREQGHTWTNGELAHVQLSLPPLLEDAVITFDGAFGMSDSNFATRPVHVYAKTGDIKAYLGSLRLNNVQHPQAGDVRENRSIAIPFHLMGEPTLKLELEIPQPRSVPGDDRLMGMALPRIIIEPGQAPSNHVTLGQVYKPTLEGGDTRFLGFWSVPEQNHTWSEGSEAHLLMNIGRLPRAEQLTVTMDLTGYAPGGSDQIMQLKVNGVDIKPEWASLAMNGQPVTDLEYIQLAGEARQYALSIKMNNLPYEAKRNGLLDVGLYFPSPASPADMEGSGDTRQLAAAIHAFRID